MVVGALKRFQARFGAFSLNFHALLRNCALARRRAADIRLALMNKAVRPGPENPPQALAQQDLGQQDLGQQDFGKQDSGQQAPGLLQLSVVVPTFNERDNVTLLYQRLAATFRHYLGGGLRRRQFP